MPSSDELFTVDQCVSFSEAEGLFSFREKPFSLHEWHNRRTGCVVVVAGHASCDEITDYDFTHFIRARNCRGLIRLFRVDAQWRLPHGRPGDYFSGCCTKMRVQLVTTINLSDRETMATKTK